MKNLNEQLNIDLKNGTWSISTSDDNLVAGTPVSKTGYEDYTTDEVETSVEPTTTTSNTSSDEEYGQRRLDSPQESLERVKLMMKYDISKTLNENKEIIKEQTDIQFTTTQTSGLPTWTNNYPCLLQNNLGTLKKTSSNDQVMIAFNNGHKIYFYSNLRCFHMMPTGEKYKGSWSCKNGKLYIQFDNGNVLDGDKFINAKDAKNTTTDNTTTNTGNTGGEYQPKEDGAYTTPGDPYQYKVVNGQWYTKSWKNREKIIKDWVSLENNPTATAELDRRHSGARVPNDTQLPPTTPEVSGEEINMPNSDF